MKSGRQKSWDDILLRTLFLQIMLKISRLWYLSEMTIILFNEQINKELINLLDVDAFGELFLLVVKSAHTDWIPFLQIRKRDLILIYCKINSSTVLLYFTTVAIYTSRTRRICWHQVWQLNLVQLQKTRKCRYTGYIIQKKYIFYVCNNLQQKSFIPG